MNINENVKIIKGHFLYLSNCENDKNAISMYTISVGVQ